MIINLHGFNSAGNNNAFAQLSAYFVPRFKLISPSYTVHNFAKGIAEIMHVLENETDFPGEAAPIFVGSSTGALYAETLASRFHGRVVLVNPVVESVQLKPLIGPQKNYATEVEYQFCLEDWKTFGAAQVDLSLPRLVFYERGDDRLDHRLTQAYYAGHAEIFVTEGDSHRFTHWAEALPAIETLMSAGKLANSQ